MTILLYFAFVLFVLGTFIGGLGPDPQRVWYSRFNLISAGLACWVGSIIFK